MEVIDKPEVQTRSQDSRVSTPIPSPRPLGAGAADNRAGINTADLLWYKDAIIYQIHVRAFYDSNDDGIGDFPGILQKLDYLSSLGVTAIWIMPFYPSPLRDDGYDIADYTTVNPSYGTLQDFQDVVREAHKRGIRVITELVINHTSDQHEWFQKSRRAPVGSYWRDFYVWSDNPNKYKGTRIIFKDFEQSNWTYDPVAKSYYWHRFYSHQPDLNFDNPEVQKTIFGLMDYWMDMGVDGMRLDAIPYLFEREGTSNENLPETHAFLKKLRAHVDEKYPGRMLLAEANQWPEDAVHYFGEGDECHMNFHFPLMPRLFMALKMEDRYSIIDILKQTPEIPENCQWATFLRNHDELTLEMVTDEERDYMYKVYAADPRARINLGVRRRLAPLVGNDRRQIELLNSLLFSLPGSPIIYYGDEIGMGDNIYLGDRDGVRTPFQWSADRNAGFSKANPQRLFLPVISSPEYNSEAINVENMQANPNSLFWWMQRLITLRSSYPELSRGKLEFLDSNNPKVLSYVRTFEGSSVVCVVNLSRNAQFVELDLSRFKGSVPTELMGQTDFPQIGELPYFLTLAPYAFYWFQINEKQTLESGQWLLKQPPLINVNQEPLRALSERDAWARFEKRLRAYLPTTRWFSGKGRRVSRIELADIFFLKQYQREEDSALVILNVSYTEGLSEVYSIGLSFADQERAERIRADRPDMVIAETSSGIFYEAILDGAFSQSVLDLITHRGTVKGRGGKLTSEFVGDEIPSEIPEPQLAGLEQSNSSLLFGKKFYLKLYRRFEDGENPEIEIGRFFKKNGYQNTAPYLGSLSYVSGGKVSSLAIVQELIENESDGWTLMLSQVSQLADRLMAEGQNITCTSEFPMKSLAEMRDTKPSDDYLSMAGYTLQLGAQLGQRTAEMHLALAHEDRDTAFIPEALTPFYQRSVFQSFRNLTDRIIGQLKKSLTSLEGLNHELAQELIAREGEIIEKFGYMKRVNVDALRIRVHGDYHLGQVIFTGQDFKIIDFEGEPARGLGERRLKRVALKDAAGMLRSFDYAAEFHLRRFVMRDQDRERIEPCLKVWTSWMSAEFMKAYLTTIESSDTGRSILPANIEETEALLDLYVLEKALYEVGYELRSRPDWVGIPLKGVLNLLNKKTT